MTVLDFMRLMYDTLDDPEKARKALDDFFIKQLLLGRLGPGAVRHLECCNQDMYAEYDALLIGGEG